MAGNFAVSPIAAKTPNLVGSTPYTIYNSDIDGEIWDSPYPSGTYGPNTIWWNGWMGTTNEIFNGEVWDFPAYTNAHTKTIIRIETSRVTNTGGLDVIFNGVYESWVSGGNTFEIASGVNEFSLAFATNGIGEPNNVLVTATLYFDSCIDILDNIPPYYMDGSSFGIDSSGVIFNGVIYLDSWAGIEIPVDMLANFQMSYGGITNFQVNASGLWIEVQGLYQYTADYGSVSFFDWIGESPIPRGSSEEEELNHYWYVTLSGMAGWYDLQIYVDFI